MPTETNPQADLLKTATDTVAQLTLLRYGVQAGVLSPQGQAALVEHVNRALEHVTKVVNDLRAMSDSDFTAPPPPPLTPPQEGKGPQHAKGHQSR